MAINTLADIETKVRRLTRSPSLAQLSKIDLDNYINTFILYDFPEHLRTFNLRRQHSFFCEPYQDRYVTDTSLLTTDPLYDFQNLYITMHPPIFIAGFESLFTQDRSQFYGLYPKIMNIRSIGVKGDGATSTFSGTIQSFGNPTPANNVMPVLQNEVLFDSIDSNFQGLALRDSPIIDAATLHPTNYGYLYNPNNPGITLPLKLNAPYLTDVNFPTGNFINYVTGKFTITFPTAPGLGQPINSQTVPFQPARPDTLLYYENTFWVRPVPDQPYKINFEVYKRPTELLATDQIPDLQEWWQYIALGAAVKIFQDRFDFDSVNLIMPEFRVQQNLCNRRTLIQYTNDRVATIYADNTSGGYGNGWCGLGNGTGGY